jgi:hypothetical protein
MEQYPLKNVNNCLNANFTPGGQSSNLFLNAVLSTPVLFGVNSVNCGSLRQLFSCIGV